MKLTFNIERFKVRSVASNQGAIHDAVVVALKGKAERKQGKRKTRETRDLRSQNPVPDNRDKFEIARRLCFPPYRKETKFKSSPSLFLFKDHGRMPNLHSALTLFPKLLVLEGRLWIKG